MPRIRTIKPEYWADEKVGNLSLQARLLFIGLLNFSDDFGVVRGHPVYIRSSIFPYDDIDKNDITLWLDEISACGMIVPFLSNGELYFEIKNFLKHQIVNRPSKSRNPKPLQHNEGSLNTHGVFNEPSLIDYGGLTDDSQSIHGGLTEGSLTERERDKEREEEFVVLTHNARAGARTREYSKSSKKSKNDEKSMKNESSVNDHGGLTEGSLSVDEGENKISKTQSCPVEKIVEIYHRQCPMLPRVQTWNGSGKKTMCQRWREDKSRQNLDWWEEYFTRVADSSFLTGKIKRFYANLNWLVGSKNMEKVINGAYDDRASAMPERLRNNIMAGIEFIEGD